MASSGRIDRRNRLIAICGSFSEVTASRHGEHVKFQVRNKTFAYYLHDHHGDGRTSLVCKAPFGEQEVLIKTDPLRFYRPSYLGSKGWIAVRLDLDDIDWTEIAELALDAYQLTAPKRLAAVAELPSL
jgi:hypothetical protein